MKAYRFKAVYNDSPLFEFQVAESSNLDFLAQNLCDSMQVEYDKNSTFMFTKKKGSNWDSNSRIDNDGFTDELKTMQFRAGKKFFIIFDEDTAEGIEIHYLSKSNDLESEFEVVSKPKKLTAAQLTKLSLKSLGKTKKSNDKKSKKSEKQEPVIEEPEEDEDFIDDEMDDDEDSLNLTDADFERDYAEEEDDMDETGIFDEDEIESIDEDLDDALDIDDEEDDYIDEEDEYYAEDDEDYIDGFENDEEEEEDDYYSDYDDDDDDDDDDYYDDDYDEEDDDDRY